MRTFLELLQSIPESRIKTSKWAEKNIDNWESHIVDASESNAIIENDGKLWNIRTGGHNWERIGELEKLLNNTHYKEYNTKDSTND